jgi:cell division topological specificity factor
MKLINDKINGKFNELVSEIVSRCNQVLASNNIVVKKPVVNSKSDACNRLKLVLMHDRSKLDPGTMEKMRDELMDVISRYVEIDKEALDLNLESEANTIALIANIPILRSK